MPVGRYAFGLWAGSRDDKLCDEWGGLRVWPVTWATSEVHPFSIRQDLFLGVRSR